MGRSVRLAALALPCLVVACGGGGSVDGPDVLPLLPDRVLAWHQILCDAVVIDHTPNLPQLPGSNVPGANAGSQRGPTRTGRAMAIVSCAIYDAVNSIDHGHTPYLVHTEYAGTASIDAAIAQAAHDTLVAMWPQQDKAFSGQSFERITDRDPADPDLLSQVADIHRRALFEPPIDDRGTNTFVRGLLTSFEPRLNAYCMLHAITLGNSHHEVNRRKA